jgi:hypothetical protein
MAGFQSPPRISSAIHIGRLVPIPLGMLAAFVIKVVAFDVQDATMRADNLSVLGKAVEECDRLYPLTTYRNGPRNNP